jgi:hypothetical protein
MGRIPYQDAVSRSGIMECLRDFDPHLVGTPPLGLALPSSDIDILCHAPNLNAAAELMWKKLCSREHFLMRQWRDGGRPIICTFSALGWLFEIYAAPTPILSQAGWRHFRVEERLLALGGNDLRGAVMRNRKAGAKTEPAFAQALGLAGDPYEEMLALFDQPDEVLAGLIKQQR